MDYKEFCKKFGVRLKYYRLLKNMTQEELADRLEVAPHYVSDIECGRRNITFKTLFKLSQALESELYKIFQFE